MDFYIKTPLSVVGLLNECLKHFLLFFKFMNILTKLHFLFQLVKIFKFFKLEYLLIKLVFQHWRITFLNVISCCCGKVFEKFTNMKEF